MSVRCLLTLTLFAAALCAAPAQAQAPAQIDRQRSRLESLQSEMRTVEQDRARAREQSDRIAAEIETATRQMVALAARVQASEDQLSRIDGQLVRLGRELAARRAVLLTRQASVSRLLGALQTLSRQPPELILARPSTATETARTASLLSGLLPELQARTAALREEIGRLQAVRSRVEAVRTVHQTTMRQLTADQTRLAALSQQRTRQRQSMLAQVERDDQRLADLAAEARDITDLLAKLDADDRRRQQMASLPGPRRRPAFAAPEPRRSEPPANVPPQVAAATPEPGRRPVAQARGDWLLPVRGDLVQQFGDRTDSGPAKGILIRARSEAQVVAPYGGRIAFAGQFRGYGLLLIIAHGDGYHSLVAGMARIDGGVGDPVRAGEPVGVMGAGAADKDLYLELRQGGRPINPLPWLVAGLRKTQG